MSTRSSLKKAYKIMGRKTLLAKGMGITYQAIDRWLGQGEMPCSEYNGKTKYSMKIEKLTGGKVTVTDLLGFIPPPQSKDWKGK